MWDAKGVLQWARGIWYGGDCPTNNMAESRALRDLMGAIW